MSEVPEPIPTVIAPATVVAPVLPEDRTRPPQVGDANMAPTTTAAEDLVPEGQRRINLIWEKMQAFVTVAVVGALVVTAVWLSVLGGLPNATEEQYSMSRVAFAMLSQTGATVVGFYFGRTNHQRTGGVGPNDTGR